MATLLAPTANAKRLRGDSLMDAFTSFRSELDEHQDRRERIVKQSRDITAASKKLIFSAHRITNTPRDKVIKDVEGKLKELKSMFAKLTVEVSGENFWRYERSISPGIQEYLEGLTFYHYILYHTIPSLEQTQASLAPAALPQPPAVESNETNPSTAPASAAVDTQVLVTVSDYLGGLADLTGEMMRLAIGSVGRSLGASAPGGAAAEDELPSIASIGRMVRELKGEMDPLVPHNRWLGKKMEVMEASLNKIETASYNLKIRGAEMPASMLKDLASQDSVARERD